MESALGDMFLGLPEMTSEALNIMLSEAWKLEKNSAKKPELMKRINRIQIRHSELRVGKLTEGLTAQMRDAISGT